MVLPGDRLHALQPRRGDEGEGGLEDRFGCSRKRSAREDIPGEEHGVLVEVYYQLHPLALT